MTRQDLFDTLWPLVDRCHLGHCWIRTKNGPRRIEETFTPSLLNEHVTGGNTYGLCPISPGASTTRVAVLDFDSHKGETPFDVMRNTADTVAMCLEEDGYRPILFRSAGGSGLHLYLVWEEPQDAYSVRQMLTKALSDCNLKPGTHGVHKGEVEIFPKQDEVPADGYGSMFVLPLGRATKSELLAGEMWTVSPDAPVLDRPEKSTPSVQISADLNRLKSALDAIPNSGDKELSYDEWRNVVFGIHHATEGSDAGLALAHTFSLRSSKYDGDFLDQRVWPYVRSDRDGALVTARSVYATAARYGWADPDVLDGFDIVGQDTGKEDRGSAQGRFAPIPALDFACNARPVSWHVKGVIPAAELVVVYGASGSGKSFFTLDLVAAIAAGTPWRDLRVRQGNVVYIAAEGATGFRNRIKARIAHTGCNPDNLYVIPESPRFAEAEDINALVKAVHSLKPSVVVVDTLSRVLAGADENSNEDMGRVVAHCSVINKVTGATVLLIHHSGKDEARGARGWSGLRAAADTEIEITRADHDRVALVTKQKDGEDGAEFGFKLATVEVNTDEDGDAVTSCIVTASAVTPKAQRAKEPRGEIERIAMDVLRDLMGLAGEAPFTNDLINAIENQIPKPDDGKRDTRRQRAGRALETLRGRGAVTFEDGKVVLL